MDANHFDELLRTLVQSPTRRGIGRMLTGVALGGMAGRFLLTDTEAKKKRKHKRRKKKCKGGKKKCGKTCCAKANCIGGVCCASDRACGVVCCQEGQVCGDPATSTCVAGQGTCPTGADSCSSANFIFCNGGAECVCAQATDGTTRCATPIPTITVDDCGQCTTDADCEQQFPDVVGVFCAANATGPCGCPAGQNLCSAPCPIL